MEEITLVRHSSGAPGLQFLGLGPKLRPSKGMKQLSTLLEKHAFWAKGRSIRELRRLLAGSTVVITLWQKGKLVGFGRATSDRIYRAVLWDVVVADELQGKGFGKKVVRALLSSPEVKNVERIYLMTTRSKEFYLQLGFMKCTNQTLLIKSV